MLRSPSHNHQSLTETWSVRHLCLAVVPPDRLDRLRDLDPTTYRWLASSTWIEAVEAIRTHPVDLVVFDPLMRGEPGLADVEQLQRQFPSLPLLAYTVLSPATAAVLLQLGRLGIRRAVFARFEDSPANFRRVLAKELEHATVQQIMRSLDTVLHRLPETLRLALETSLHTPGDRITAETLAAQAGMTQYECQAWFARASLPAPRVTLVLLRLLYAHRLLLDPGHTIDDVARKLGYGKTQTLQAQLRLAYGMTAGELRHELPDGRAVTALLNRYFGTTVSAASDHPGLAQSAVG